MAEKIIDKQTASHYTWGDNCDSWILVDSKDLSVKQESMPGGTSEKLHFHHIARQFFFIMKGTATFYVDNEKIIVSEQKGLQILPETAHLIANETAEILDFLVISQPGTNTDRIKSEPV
jgi:mannose-6-phosphate isomerase-like protein (cupin superfamily)